MSTASPAQMLGEVVLGQYLVDRILGDGAFAWVYHGRSKDGSEVAVKVLHLQARAAAMRFAREASVLRALPPNPSVVRLIDQGTSRAGLPLLVLEHVDGITLKEGMRRLPRPPPRRAVAFVADLCRAFAGLHQLGVAHRDVKPANILLGRQGGIKLIDFGIIRDAEGILGLLEEEADPLGPRVFGDELDAGVLAGSLPYMAPEQFSDFLDRSQVRADVRSDVFSLGVILYELLAGESPFSRPPPLVDCSAEELLDYARHRLALTDDDVPVLPGVDVALESVVCRALRVDPDRRQHDARVFMAELVAYLTTGASAPLVEAGRTVEVAVLGEDAFEETGEQTERELASVGEAAETAKTPVSGPAETTDERPSGPTALFFDEEPRPVAKPGGVPLVRPVVAIHEAKTAPIPVGSDTIPAVPVEEDQTTRWRPSLDRTKG